MAYVGAFALWLAAFTLLTASIVRFVQWVMVNGVGATAQAAIFNVVRGEKRGQVIAFAFAVPVNLGVLAAGVGDSGRRRGDGRDGRPGAGG